MPRGEHLIRHAATKGAPLTLFEYIAIAFSMVFSFTVLRLVGGLPYVTRPGRIYWVHLLFLLTALVYVLNAFWALWSYRDVDWTYPRYVLALASPGAQYFAAAVLVPGEPAEVGSWRTHYYATRRRFFVGVIVLTVVGAVATTELAGMPLGHPARFGQLATLAVGVAGLASADPRLHAVLSVACLLGVVGFGAVVLARPGALG